MDFVTSLITAAVGFWACWHWFLADWLEAKGLFRLIRGRKAASQISDEAYFDQVAAELNAGVLRQGLWAKALAESGGDQVKARAAYMKLRVAAMKDEVARRFSEADNNSNEEKIVVPCPQCQTGLRLPADKTLDVRCPKCNHSFRIATTKNSDPDIASGSSNLVGRIGRLAFLKWLIIQFVAGFALTIYLDKQNTTIPIGWLLILAAAGILWWVAVVLARIQDANKSLWLMVFGFIPYVNFLLAFYLLVIPGTKGSNKYGPPDTGLLR